MNNKETEIAIKPPFQIHFSNLNEVRMGSPYNRCDIELSGIDRIRLPKAEWQDKYAWSSEFKMLILVKWDFTSNIPGFHLVAIDTQTGNGKESPKLLGLLNSLSIINKTVRFNKFLYDKEKSTGELCCNVNEEYTFPD